MEGGGVELFVGATGASEQVAAQYIKSAKGDVDLAVAMFLSEQEEAGGEAGSGVAPEAASPAPGGAAASEGLAAVDSILNDVRSREVRSEAGAGSSPGKGPGQGAGAGQSAGQGEAAAERSVFVVFFADGFMVDEDFEPPKPEVAEQPTAPAPRRTGMMGLNDLKKDSKSRGPMPKLPKLKPLRSYDTPENKAFLADVKAGRVPLELQKRDSQGAPIPVSIALDDVRPKTYEELAKVIKQMEGMQREVEGERDGGGKPAGPVLFAGAGNTLSSSSSAGASASAGSGGGAGAGPGADPALLAIVSGRAAEVDESRPVANIQLRFQHSGARVKARLNLDSTVADLWRLVAAEMGAQDLSRSILQALGLQTAGGRPPSASQALGVARRAKDDQPVRHVHIDKVPDIFNIPITPDQTLTLG